MVEYTVKEKNNSQRQNYHLMPHFKNKVSTEDENFK